MSNNVNVVVLPHKWTDATCFCKKSPQTAGQLLWECELLRKQRQVLRNSIMKVGGSWPITNYDFNK
jgi:hypothetical protein